MDEDLLVVGATKDAEIVRGKSQAPNEAMVFRLDFSRVPFVAALINGPQSDGFVSIAEDQKGPIIREFH